MTTAGTSVTATVDTHSIAMVRNKAAKLKRRMPANVLLDDLVQCGMVGLLRAIEGYDSSKGTPFQHYAQRWITGRMLNYLNLMDLSNDDLVNIDDIAITSDSATPEQMAELRDTIRIIESVTDDLSDSRKSVIHMHYSENLSITEIAHLRGCGVPSVSRHKIASQNAITAALNRSEVAT